MKKTALIIVLIVFGNIMYGATLEKSKSIVEKKLFYVSHDSFRMETGKKVIYTDPFNIPDGAKRADIILITHQHQDHLQLESINKIADKNTVIIAPVTAEYELKNKVLAKLRRVKVGDNLKLDGIIIEVKAAYN